MHTCSTIPSNDSRNVDIKRIRYIDVYNNRNIKTENARKNNPVRSSNSMPNCNRNTNRCIERKSNNDVVGTINRIRTRNLNIVITTTSLRHWYITIAIIRINMNNMNIKTDIELPNNVTLRIIRNINNMGTRNSNSHKSSTWHSNCYMTINDISTLIDKNKCVITN